MKVLDAIDTKGITSEGVNELTTMVHDKMQNTFNELSIQTTNEPSDKNL